MVLSEGMYRKVQKLREENRGANKAWEDTLERRREEGRQEGEIRNQIKWESWNYRRLEEKKKGMAFDEAIPALRVRKLTELKRRIASGKAAVRRAVKRVVMLGAARGVKKALSRARQEGLEEGEIRNHAKWVTWNDRRLQGRSRGFDEPLLTLEAINEDQAIVQARWESWDKLRREAESKGLPFDMPPPTLEDLDSD